jgi:spermidine synthase
LALRANVALPAVGERRRALALYGLVFCAGSGAMATEIAASRLLAPFYGSSTAVWANIIGLVLGSLALGYWLGGHLADRHPSMRLLGLLVLAAAAGIAATPFAARPILNVVAAGVDGASIGAVVGSFFGALLLFAPTVVVLGMVAPFAIRVGIDDVRSAGSTAGRVFALSTAGSLLGTFVPALVSIPLLGTQRTLIAAAVLVATGGALVLGPRWLAAPCALATLLVIGPGAVKDVPGLLYEEESAYQYVQVVQDGPDRLLYLNEGIAKHSIWRRDWVLTGGEWDMFLVVPPLVSHTVTRVAILGNAGGTTARAFGVFYPSAWIDGVELDPAVTAVGRRFFGLDDNPRLDVYTADARPFLRRSRTRYDLIFVDAYRQPYVPFYLATREFFRLALTHLRPGGAVALNVATVPGDTRLAEAVAGTLAADFPQVLTWQALRFNQLVVGLSRPAGPAVLARRLDRIPPQLEPLARLFRLQAHRAAPASDPWTDDRAPVEWITDRMLAGYAARSGNLHEDLLPTAP